MGVPGPIGGIQPFAELAQGATTVVYKGYQGALDRFVLLKVLRPGADEELTQRFEQEARLIARVQHPNVVAVYDYGRADGRAYLAAEFVEGDDLETLIGKGPIPPVLAAFILREAARGLGAAHAQGVLHRDVKPANLLVSLGGQVKVTDFGLASAGDEDEAEVRGTLAYLAPEQVRGAAPTPQADLFALGATFFEMLTGRRAFRGSTASELLAAVQEHDPVPFLAADASLPRALVEAGRRLLAPDPAARYPSAAALVADLNVFLDAQPSPPDGGSLQAYMQDPDAFKASQAAVVGPPTVVDPAARADAGAPGDKGRAAARGRRRTAPRYAVAVALAVLLGAVSLALWGASEGDGPEQHTALDTPAVRFTPPHAETSEGDSLRTPQALSRPGPAMPGAAPELPMEASSDQPPARGDAEIPPATTEGEQEARAEARAPAGGRPEPAQALPGRLRVDAQPWADVYLDGELVGPTPVAPRLLPAGTYVVELRNEAFPLHRTQVTVTPGETAAVSVSLWELVGTLQVEVSPWAYVYVDGVVRDTIPPAGGPLIVPPGDHVLRVENPFLGSREARFRIEAGEQRTFRFTLEAP